MLRYVLLALLSEGIPRHGYALMKAFAERSGVRLSIGNIYRELQRLTGEGLIATVANPIGADPRRAPYAITAAGRHALEQWLAMPARALARGSLDALGYRLALLGDIDADRADAFLDDLQGELWGQAKEIEAARSARERPAADCFPVRAFLQSRQARYLAVDLELIAEMRGAVAAWRARAETPSETGLPVDAGRRPARRLRGGRAGTV
jgi:DNA-binding PadR family transcriptional regulator